MREERMRRKILLTVFVMCITIGATRSQATLVGHWKFDEGSGTTAVDSSSYSNNGTLTNMDPGTDWITGVFGGALDFDGVDDYVDLGVPASTGLDVSGAFTVALWAKPRGFNSSWNYLMRHKSKFEFGFYDTVNAEKPEFKLKNDSGDRFSVRGSELTVGHWYHIVGVRDGSFMGIYVNGVLVDSRNDFAGNLTSNAEFLGIGGEDGDDSFNGAIDDVRIYNHALTQEEIAAIIPEPTTIALLAFGCGLKRLLRRRYK